METNSDGRILWILFTAFTLCVTPAWASAQMAKVDESELARTNAPLGRMTQQIDVPVIRIMDNMVLPSPQIERAGGDKNLNFYAPPNLETWSYNYSTLNPNYWGGSVSGSRSR